MRRGPASGARSQRFTAADVHALRVHDDIKLSLTDDLAADIPEGERGSRSDLPHWSARHAGTEGVAVAVWQMFAPPPGVDVNLPSWLRKQGISWFRGWIRHAGPEGPDFVMDWVIDIDNDTYETARDGDTGPYSPPPGCDLQAFVDAVASLSRDLLLDSLTAKMNLLKDIGAFKGDKLRSPLESARWQAWLDLTLGLDEPRGWAYALEELRAQRQQAAPD
jgi:hypothetical protein